MNRRDDHWTERAGREETSSLASVVRGAFVLILLALVGMPAPAEEDAALDREETNAAALAVLSKQAGQPGTGGIQTIAGQAYLPAGDIEAETIAMWIEQAAREAGDETAVAARRNRLNLEIHFDIDSAELDDEARADLDELAKALSNDYGGVRFALCGHTDRDGPEAYNQDLSVRRAEQAREYLVENHGVEAGRLVAEGFGESDPLLEETSPREKQINRRVDLRVVRGN